MSARKGRSKTTSKKSAAAAPPVQLTIAAYGKKKKKKTTTPPQTDEEEEGTYSNTSNTDGTEESNAELDEEAEALEDTPIVLSIPVTDAMENKFTNPSTLDAELTRYRPDVDERAPLSRVSGTTAGSRVPQQKDPSKKLVVKRCPVCVDKAGPCKECQAKFNKQFERSLSDYQSAREEQDKMFAAPDPTNFRNVTISDQPLPKDFKPPEYHYRKGVQGKVDPADLEKQPQGYAEAGWDLDDGDETGGAMTQQQREQYQQAEIDRLRRKVALLEDMLANNRTAIDVQGSNAPPAPFVNECMWHMAPFYSEPVGLPLHFDPITGTFDSIGCFCSLQCAYAYRLEHRSAEAAPLHLLFKAHRMLQQSERIRQKAREEETGEEAGDPVVFTELIPAPPRQALRRWGGSMELDEFLNQSQVWHTLSRRPFVPTEEFVEISSDRSTTTTTTTFRAPSEHSAGDGLVRRRNKPHPNAANQWNNAIRRSRLRR